MQPCWISKMLYKGSWHQMILKWCKRRTSILAWSLKSKRGTRQQRYTSLRLTKSTPDRTSKIRSMRWTSIRRCVISKMELKKRNLKYLKWAPPLLRPVNKLHKKRHQSHQNQYQQVAHQHLAKSKRCLEQERVVKQLNQSWNKTISF